MRMILLRQTHGLLQNRMRQAALDLDHDGLVVLVAHHHALQDAFRHLFLLLRGLRAAALLHRLDAGNVAPHLTDARGLFELARRLLEAQVELLLLEPEQPRR